MESQQKLLFKSYDALFCQGTNKYSLRKKLKNPNSGIQNRNRRKVSIGATLENHLKIKNNFNSRNFQIKDNVIFVGLASPTVITDKVAREPGEIDLFKKSKLKDCGLGIYQ